MENALENIRKHYEQVVSYYITPFKFKANILKYKDACIGYSLFEIGRNMGFHESLKELIAFLECARVDTDKENEIENIRRITSEILNYREEQNVHNM